MFFSKLNAMSVGTVWVMRDQKQSTTKSDHADFSSETYCAVCGKPWEQSSVEAAPVVVVTADPIIDETQQKLVANCLTAAGWGGQSTSFALHASCSSNHQSALHALRLQIDAQQPELIIVFGLDAAQLIDAQRTEFVPGQIQQFENTRLIATHHPEEMISAPALKAQVWADLCLISPSRC